MITRSLQVEQTLKEQKLSVVQSTLIMDREKVDDKDSFVKEALMLHQALSLCSSLVDEESRFEAAFFESVRVLVIRLTNTGGCLL